MKTTALIATALIATSTTAMAGTFSVQARATASASFHVGPTYVPSVPVIHDHRTAPPPVTPVNRINDNRYGSVFDGPTLQHLPVPPAGVDCRNWDPVADVGSACSVYATTSNRGVSQPYLPGWASLGARESSVPDMQYITVERSFNELWVAPIQGRPSLSGVGIKFMDGTWQTITLDGNFARGNGELIKIKGGARHEISQIVFYAAQGSRGEYTAFAR